MLYDYTSIGIIPYLYLQVYLLLNIRRDFLNNVCINYGLIRP